MPEGMACSLEELGSLLRATQQSASPAAPTAWPSTGAAFLLGMALCALCIATFALTLRRSAALRTRLESMARTARAGLPLDTLASMFGGDLPSWLSSPDVARMGWANVALEGLWPQIDAAATKWAVLEGNLESLMNATTFWRPSWLATSGISIKGMALGQVPPVMMGVRAYKRDEDTCADRVMLDFDFSWASQMSVAMDIRVLPASTRLPLLSQIYSFISRRSIVRVFVKDLAVSGVVRTQLRPLINRIPVVSSYGINPLFIPGLEHFIQSFVTGTVLQPFTYPDGFVLKLDPEADDSIAELPEGLLTVVVKEATGVPRMDFIGGADPYVKLWVNESVKLHTSVKPHTRHPRWNETFRMTVHDLAHQTLRFIMYDSDTLRRDDEVGRMELVLGELDLSVPRDLVLLVPRTGKSAARSQGEQVGFTAVKARNSETAPGEGMDCDARGGPALAFSPAASRGSGGVATSSAARRGIARPSGPEQGSEGPLWREDLVEDDATSGQTTTRQRWEKLADQSLDLFNLRKACELHIHVAFSRFDRGDVVDAMRQAREGVSGGDPGDVPYRPRPSDNSRTRELHRVFSGGVLCVHLDHAADLYSKGVEGYTKNMRCRLSVGAHSRVTECSRSKLVSRRNPVFDQRLELILDGDEAEQRGLAVSVELFTTHLLLKPTYKGRVDVPLQDVVTRRRVTGSWPLQGVPSGQLTMTLTWVSALEQGV